jgi:hypothetical protein
MEQWKPIIGFESIYEVSDHGNVRSIKLGKLKKISLDKTTNRQFLNLWKNNKQNVVRIHKLVLEAFVGQCPNGLECCHNDGNSLNNHLSNLRWDTHTSNIHDRIKHGTSNRGERCGTAKLTLEQVRQIRTDTRLQRIIASEYNIAESMISRIKNGERWQHDI